MATLLCALQDRALRRPNLGGHWPGACRVEPGRRANANCGLVEQDGAEEDHHERREHADGDLG